MHQNNVSARIAIVTNANYRLIGNIHLSREIDHFLALYGILFCPLFALSAIITIYGLSFEANKVRGR